MADSDTDARRERLKKAREALGTPAKPKGLRHPDVEGDDPLGDGAAAGNATQFPGGGLRGRLGQGAGLGGGLRGQGGAGGGLRGGLRGRLGQGGGLGGGLRGRLGQGGGVQAGAGAAGGGDPAAQRAFLQDRLEKLQAKLAELDTGVEDATIVEDQPGPGKKS